MSTLLQALRGSDMVEIDGLYAWQFSLTPDAPIALSIECMDGKELRRWQFTLAQLEAATEDTENAWHLSNELGEYRIQCFNAICASNDDEPA